MGTGPTSYTQPGAFTQKFTKTGSPITVTVPTAAFYGIHLDVERAIFSPALARRDGPLIHQGAGPSACSRSS